MSTENHLPEQNKITLAFLEPGLESEFKASYDKSVKIPLRYGIIISILSWFSAIWLIYSIIPEDLGWLSMLTIAYIGSFFGFIVYATFNERFQGYYHFIGACSNAWAGLYAIYFCDQFPNGENLTLPVLIFIIFFGSYMVRLRWIAGFIAALTYTIGYHIYIANFSDLTSSQVTLYAFVGWMTLIFAVLAGRVAEHNNRIAYVQRKTIREQSLIIEGEKEALLKEVHHRVKNNLQIIVSLINLQLSKFDSDQIKVALKETQGRVMSMSLVHQKMHQTANFSEITLHDYVRQIIDNGTQLYADGKVSYDLVIAEDVAVDIETAIPLGLILNEIVSNFFKHCSAEGSTDQRFSIQVTKDTGNTYLLRYSDKGPGFPEGLSVEEADSLGLELIDALTNQVDGSFKFYNDGGAVYELRLDF